MTSKSGILEESVEAEQAHSSSHVTTSIFDVKTNSKTNIQTNI